MLKLLRCFSSATSVVAVLALSVAGCDQAVSHGVVINGISSRSKAPQVDPDEQDQPAKDSKPEGLSESAETSAAKGTAGKDWEDISSAKFSHPTTSTNEWFPLKPGTQFTWAGTSLDDEGQEEAHWIVFTVTDLTRDVAGVTTVVCWDQDYVADVGEPFEKAELVETEIVFFAQADDGAVWHFGEYPEEYEDGNLIKSPGWLHGLADGKAGIHIPGKPKLGDPSFAQGWAPSVPWTDRAVVFQVGQQVKVPAGTYDDVIVFDESCKEDPDAHALKYYARGVGGVRVGSQGDTAGKENLDLVKLVQLDDVGMAKAREAAQKLQKGADALYAKMKNAAPKVVTPQASGEKEFEDFASAKFSHPTTINNEWFPLKPGMQFTWEGTSVDDEGTEEVHWVIFTVTDLTREVAGVTTVVCWDQDHVADVGEPFEKAELVETEAAFFAQADDGTVWHLGQYPEEYEDGKLIAAPAWLHGLKDGKAGIYMPGKPQLGDPSFSQGWSPSVPWTDRAVVYQVGQQVKGPTGSYEDVLVFEESCKEDPGNHALKYYARGVGSVRVGWRGEPTDKENLELVKLVQLDDAGMAKAREATQKLQKGADVLFAKMNNAEPKVTDTTVAVSSVALQKASAEKEKTDPATLGTEEFGLTKRELVQKIEQVEALIAKFMREEGFQYVACDYKTVYSGMAADKSMPGVSEEEFISKYGFGVSTMYTGQPPQLVNGYSPTKVGLGAKNIEIFKSLSPADQVAYNRTLFGEKWDASFAVGLETENFSRCGGCTRKAIEQVFKGDQLKSNYYNPKDALINKDPRMKAALRTFVEKMRAEGFTYNHPDEVETDLRERLAAITGGEFIPVEKMAPEKLDALKKLQEYERRVAMVSFKLQGDVFEPVEEKIERELFAREVK